VTIMSGPNRRARSAYLLDPDGYAVEVFAHEANRAAARRERGDA